MFGSKRYPTIRTVIGLLLVVYISVYVVLSLGGRYEPSGLGLGGVKFHEWAPRGFHSDLAWQKGPMLVFLPLHVLDKWIWHDQDAIDSGRYPVTEVAPKDVWKYYQAEGFFEDLNVDGDSAPALVDSPRTLEKDNSNQVDVSPAQGGAFEGFTGTITLDGQPLDNATVEFVPIDGGKPAGGRTNADGQFQLEKGAVPGEYRVRIIPKTSPTTGKRMKTKADTGKNSGGDTSEEESGR